MSVFEDPDFENPLLPFEEVPVLASIYVKIYLDIDPSNSQFYVQV